MSNLHDNIKQIAEAEILRWYDRDIVGLDDATSTIAQRVLQESLMRVGAAVETAAVETLQSLEVNGAPSAADSAEIRFQARRIAERAVRTIVGWDPGLVGPAVLGDGGGPRSRQPQGPRETQQGAATPEHGATAQGAGQALGNVAEPQSGPTALRISPPADIIDLAIHATGQSPCRSRRGVVIYHPVTDAVLGWGHNGPPLKMGCPGRAHCAGNCGVRSVHAEARALRQADQARQAKGGMLLHLELVHVERSGLGPDVVACDGPSCPTCAREILDVGFVAGVWLYEVTPPASGCPYIGRASRLNHLSRENCAYCARVSCLRCKPAGGSDSDCAHGDDDRHWHMQRIPVTRAWRRYTAEEFYHETLRRCGLSLP